MKVADLPASPTSQVKSVVSSPRRRHMRVTEIPAGPASPGNSVGSSPRSTPHRKQRQKQAHQQQQQQHGIMSFYYTTPKS